MSQAKPGHDGSPNGIDLTLYPTAQKLANRSLEFLQEIQNLYFSIPLSPPLPHTTNPSLSTPGAALEARLNRDYGPGNPYYEDFCTLIKRGLAEGWVASGELDGPKYRRGRIRLPLAENLYMSLTTVYFDSQEVYAGQYHKHPYGE
jgi:hypothetical protein